MVVGRNLEDSGSGISSWEIYQDAGEMSCRTATEIVSVVRADVSIPRKNSSCETRAAQLLPQAPLSRLAKSQLTSKDSSAKGPRKLGSRQEREYGHGSTSYSDTARGASHCFHPSIPLVAK